MLSYVIFYQLVPFISGKLILIYTNEIGDEYKEKPFVRATTPAECNHTYCPTKGGGNIVCPFQLLEPNGNLPLKHC